MAKIELEDFVCALKKNLKGGQDGNMQRFCDLLLDCTLLELGYKVEGGKLVEYGVLQKIAADNFYVCLRTTDGYDSFTKGKIYYSPQKDILVADNQTQVKIVNPSNFRLATRNELKTSGIIKFEEGDYIRDVNYHGEPIYKVMGIGDANYTCKAMAGEHFGDSAVFSFTNPYLRPWSIKNAKSGDFLADKYDCVCIFRKTMIDEEDGDLLVDVYCGINTDGNFVVNEENEVWCCADELFPADETHKKLLADKMRESYYEWDVKKNELKYIPRFKEGQRIIHKDDGQDVLWKPRIIIQVDEMDKKYRLHDGSVVHFSEQNEYEETNARVEIEPKFKRGDNVLWDGEVFTILGVDTLKQTYNLGGYVVTFYDQHKLTLVNGLIKGRWYVCIKNGDGVRVGKVYKAIGDGVLKDDEGSSYWRNKEIIPFYFRDATDDDMEKVFKAGDVVNYVSSHPAYSGLYLLGQPNDLHIGYDNANTPYNIALRNCTLATNDERKQFMRELNDNGYVWDDKELKVVFVNNQQRSDDSQEALTEFELAVGREIFDEPFDAKIVKTIKIESAKLLSIARKQIVSELKDYRKEAPETLLSAEYLVGIEDSIKEISKEE